jgi:CheY-like chemotaxis protein
VESPQHVAILVAEDNPFIADLLRQGLSRAVRRRIERQVQWSFESAKDGKQALELLEQGEFDLLICDVMMPVVDGIELIRRVRSEPSMKTMKVLAMSAGGPDAERAALDAGADFFLDKPLVLGTLVEAMVALLGL